MKYPTYPILIVDDEKEVLRTEVLALTLGGINNVIICSESREVLTTLEKEQCGIIVLDITMPYIDGLKLLEIITNSHPEISVIMLTGRNDAETAVTCMKIGAFDYVVKPIDNIRLVTSVQKAIEHRNLYLETDRLKKGFLTNTLVDPYAFHHIVSDDEHIFTIYRYIEAIAPTMLPILITGETGVGKELFAKACHLASKVTGEFICINTAGIDDTLLSDMLFGHKKGSFTGADYDRSGLIYTAKGGTLFFDEIGDLKADSQIKLLRLLQEGTYYKVGSDVPEQCEARLIFATNVDLQEAKNQGQFRKDLYYRLKSHHIHIPPLRERSGDIPLLLDHFLSLAAKSMNKKSPTPPRELTVLLQNYHYPGNIRELRGMIYDAVGRHTKGILSLESFKKIIQVNESNHSLQNLPPEKHNHISFPDPLPSMKEMEEALVNEALKRSQGNKSLAANMLGITRKTLRNKTT